MDKMIGKTIQKVMGKGEEEAPVKDIKLKVGFQKKGKYESKKKDLATKCKM